MPNDLFLLKLMYYLHYMGKVTDWFCLFPLMLPPCPLPCQVRKCRLLSHLSWESKVKL